MLHPLSRHPIVTPSAPAAR